MINTKSLGIFAGIGFAISFLTGIISKNAFFSVLIKAFVFSIVFAVIAYLISFLFNKFLSDGSSVPDSVVESEHADNHKPVGGIVDVSITDENLEEEEHGPKFFVENNRQSFGAESLSERKNVNLQNNAPKVEIRNDSLNTEKKQIEAEEIVDSSDKSSFKPISLTQTNTNVRSNDVGVEEVIENTSESIDELPDIGNLSIDKKNNEIDDIISDSEFASEGEIPSRAPVFPDGQVADGQDANVMAQAIRTLLSKDN